MIIPHLYKDQAVFFNLNPDVRVFVLLGLVISFKGFQILSRGLVFCGWNFCLLATWLVFCGSIDLVVRRMNGVDGQMRNVICRRCSMDLWWIDEQVGPCQQGERQRIFV